MLFRESGVGSINNPQVDFFLLSPITCLKNINGPNCFNRSVCFILDSGCYLLIVGFFIVNYHHMLP